MVVIIVVMVMVVMVMIEMRMMEIRKKVGHLCHRPVAIWRAQQEFV